MKKPFGFSDAVASDSIKKELTRFFLLLANKMAKYWGSRYFGSV